MKINTLNLEESITKRIYTQSKNVKYGHYIFTRTTKNVLKTVRKHTTVNQRKSVWIYHFGRDDYEVQSTGKDKVTPNY